MPRSIARISIWKKAVPLLVIILSSFLGIASRKFGYILLPFLAKYTGDTMWTLAFCALFRMLFTRQRNWEIAIIAFDFSCLIELSQLWHPVWLDRIRSTVFGGLLFGFGFRYIDLFCYAAGCVLGLFIFSLIPEG
ncbi:MAG: DUF2809 domain-containing protein [Candidatus Cloacimonetes bacterium]|nr:DUF2809 domain-containing protein [Candidatus Cloacimonadota bacterium]